MSKKFKGKTCVYCGVEGISETVDHVVAREFLPVPRRDGIPKVAACRPCNNAKSQLEHYLVAVLPFGSRHPTASVMLDTEAPRRLAGNRRLHRDLAAGHQDAWLTENGITQRTITLPFDGRKLDALFALVTRGLAAHHFGVVIPKDSFIGTGTLAGVAEPFMTSLLVMNARAKVTFAWRRTNQLRRHPGHRRSSSDRLAIPHVWRRAAIRCRQPCRNAGHDLGQFVPIAFSVRLQPLIEVVPRVVHLPPSCQTSSLQLQSRDAIAAT